MRKMSSAKKLAKEYELLRDYMTCAVGTKDLYGKLYNEIRMPQQVRNIVNAYCLGEPLSGIEDSFDAQSSVYTYSNIFYVSLSCTLAIQSIKTKLANYHKHSGEKYVNVLSINRVLEL